MRCRQASSTGSANEMQTDQFNRQASSADGDNEMQAGQFNRQASSTGSDNEMQAWRGILVVNTGMLFPLLKDNNVNFVVLFVLSAALF